MKKLTNDEVIKRFREKHGDKYDYSKVDYVNARTKICIICPKHGEFWQKPSDHIRGVGCPECNRERLKCGPRRFEKEDFIKRAIEKHGDKYDYSKVEYVDCRTKVCIICPEHGEFWQTPLCHLKTNGCPKCRKKFYNKETFIEEAYSKYGNKYDYSKVIYESSTKKVCIICPEHGEFYITPYDFIKGHKCTQCAKKDAGDKNRKDTISFVKRSKEIHGDKYDYSKVEYVNNRTKVCIICPEHGEFWQRPSSHLSGYGCPTCNESHLERDVRKILIDKNIGFEQYKRFNWLGLQTLDFYLPCYNIAIECQGIQHFEEVQYFGGNKALAETKKRDKKKNELCKEHNIEIFYINYDDNVNNKIKELIRDAVRL